MNRELHKQHAEKFVSELFSEQYAEYIHVSTPQLNDDSDDEFTAFVVDIEAKIGKRNRHSIVLRSNDDGDIELLQGEDFVEVDRVEALEYMFIDNLVDWEG